MKSKNYSEVERHHALYRSEKNFRAEVCGLIKRARRSTGEARAAWRQHIRNTIVSVRVMQQLQEAL